MFRWLKKSNETQVMVNEMNEAHSCLVRTLEAFNGENVRPINKASLMSFPLFKWVYLDETTKKVRICRRKMLFGDHFNFDTEMEEGGEFGKHFHADLIESAEVIKGRMKDMVDGKIYSEGDVMHYEKGERHTPIALEKSMLKVIFKP